MLLAATPNIVTTSIILSDVVPRPLAGGGGAFHGGMGQGAKDEHDLAFVWELFWML